MLSRELKDLKIGKWYLCDNIFFLPISLNMEAEFIDNYVPKHLKKMPVFKLYYVELYSPKKIIIAKEQLWGIYKNKKDERKRNYLYHYPTFNKLEKLDIKPASNLELEALIKIIFKAEVQINNEYN